MTQRNQPRTSEERLLLEEKLAQRQLRQMRSKLSIIAMSWCDTATFDLIRSGLSRTTFPSRGRLFSVPAGFFVDFCRSNVGSWRAGHAPPLHS